MCISHWGNGQQYALYTQYMFNGLAINPAYAGSNEALNVTAFSRRQWTNVEGAPTTTGVSAHTPIKKESMGLGLIIAKDKITIFNQTSVNLTYAYHVPLAENKKLSLGLQAGFAHHNASYTSLTSKTPDDPARAASDINTWSPSFGTGAYYYTNRFYAGLSIPYLASNLLRTKNIRNEIHYQNNYFFATGYVMSLSPHVQFKPNLLVKYMAGNPIQVDLNANFLFKEVLWAGASLRSLNALSFLTQVNLTEQLKFGYSYDINLGPLSGLSKGAHEFVISYLFSFNRTNIDSPRYF